MPENIDDILSRYEPGKSLEASPLEFPNPVISKPSMEKPAPYDFITERQEKLHSLDLPKQEPDISKLQIGDYPGVQRTAAGMLEPVMDLGKLATGTADQPWEATASVLSSLIGPPGLKGGKAVKPFYSAAE